MGKTLGLAAAGSFGGPTSSKANPGAADPRHADGCGIAVVWLQHLPGFLSLNCSAEPYGSIPGPQWN